MAMAGCQKIYPKWAARYRNVEKSADGLGLDMQTHERDAYRVVRKTKQFPRDETCERRVQRKDNRVRITVATPGQWAVLNNFVRANGAIIAKNRFCAVKSKKA